MHDSHTIEVITGGMYAGKSEFLMLQLRKAKHAKARVLVFKPAIDNRYDDTNIVSHIKNAFEATAVQSASDVERLAQDADVVGIDEAQFFGHELFAVCVRLANAGKRVIVAGLDQDYLGNSFPNSPMPALAMDAEKVTKLRAVCDECGDKALRSERTAGSAATVDIGSQDKYLAKCRKHFKIHDLA